jgi:hypothetical protein
MSISIQKRTNEIKNVFFYINFFFKYTYINPIVPLRTTQFFSTREITYQTLAKFALPGSNPIVPRRKTQFSPTTEITYKTLAKI